MNGESVFTSYLKFSRSIIIFGPNLGIHFIQSLVMLTRLLLLISIAASLLLRRWLPIWLFVGYIAFKIYQVATKNYFEGVDKRLKGPPGVPFLGSVFWMQGDWSEQSHKWSKTYGPIYRVLLAGIAQVVVADLEYAKEVVNNPALQYKAEDIAETVQEALGKNSLVMIGGKEWRMQRSALSKIFHQKNMTDFMETMNSAAQILIKKMNDINKTFSFDVDQHYMRLAADVIIKTFFSLDLNIQTDSNVPILNAINSLAETVQSWFFSPWERLNVFALRKFYKQRKFLRGYFHDLIEGRRANPDARQGRPDVVDLMIQVKDDETGQPALTTEAIIDQAITFFFAGHDTTAHTMSWTTYLLAEHPEHQDKVHEEIVSVLGDNEHVTMTDIPKLKYLLGAIKESLRLYPATSTLTRQAQEDFTVGGYEFKKGTIVTLALAAIHFDEKYWPDPYKFDPTRHTVETNAEDPAQFFKWWPFSLKERNCIGMNFALLELRIVLALMFKHFEFRPDRLRPPVPGTKFTTYPTNGLNVFLRKRNNK